MGPTIAQLTRFSQYFRRFYARQFTPLMERTGLTIRDIMVLLFLANHPEQDTAGGSSENHGGGGAAGTGGAGAAGRLRGAASGDASGGGAGFVPGAFDEGAGAGGAVVARWARGCISTTLEVAGDGTPRAASPTGCIRRRCQGRGGRAGAEARPYGVYDGECLPGCGVHSHWCGGRGGRADT